MPSPASIEHEILGILGRRHSRVALTPETSLGSEGMGLDSIAIVEVLLECEEHFGVLLASDMLSADGITIGGLTERVRTLVRP
jgi:acyl carrier protein